MSYLRQFRKFLLAISSKLDKLPHSVSAQEQISRFIFNKRHMIPAKGEVKVAAFMPNSKTNDVSVYRIGNCSEKKIWVIADFFVERKRSDKRKLLGRGDLTSSVVFQQDLKIIADPSRRLKIILAPSRHPRHANVTNWPNDRPTQKLIAEKLALNAVLSLRH